MLLDDPWLFCVSEGRSEEFVEILKERRRMKRAREYAYDVDCTVTRDVAGIFPKKLHTLRNRTTPFTYSLQ